MIHDASTVSHLNKIKAKLFLEATKDNVMSVSHGKPRKLNVSISYNI